MKQFNYSQVHANDTNDSQNDTNDLENVVNVVNDVNEVKNGMNEINGMQMESIQLRAFLETNVKYKQGLSLYLNEICDLYENEYKEALGTQGMQMTKKVNEMNFDENRRRRIRYWPNC